jgi:flagellum-specific ATP synthase
VIKFIDDTALSRLARRLEVVRAEVPLVRVSGRITAATPSGFELRGLSQDLKLGALVEIDNDGLPVLSEVIRLTREDATVKPIGGEASLALGSMAHVAGDMVLRPHESWKGRLIDGLGRPTDGGGALVQGNHATPLRAAPPEAMRRQPVSKPTATGLRAVDIFTPLCLGQRIGVFAGSGVGKSTTLSMMARAQGFEVIVVALVGERGREVREFVEHTLGDLARRAVIVVSTGDESAMMRRLAPLTAMATAEYFRDAGNDVLLIMDSVTRYAHACRDVALAAGEPPVARGFPPSVFSDLPQLLERAGPGSDGGGTITGIFAVLVDGDDHNDPVADAIRGTLDGHIVLDRAIAEGGRYPAIDLLKSVSRLAARAWTADQRQAVSELRKLVARYEDSRDLRAIGGYQPGADPELDKAVTLVPKLYRALSQSPEQPASRDPFRDIAEVLAK